MVTFNMCVKGPLHMVGSSERKLMLNDITFRAHLHQPGRIRRPIAGQAV